MFLFCVFSRILTFLLDKWELFRYGIYIIDVENTPVFYNTAFLAEFSFYSIKIACVYAMYTQAFCFARNTLFLRDVGSSACEPESGV